MAICRSAWPRRSTVSPTIRNWSARRKTTLQLREVRLSAGAGFVVGICGDIMTMPGLPRHPAAEGISLNSDGEIEGLY
jgi:formate--tetrahydrofolate ligase